jgi:ankyrin repeat protein
MTGEPAKPPVVKLTDAESALLIASFRGDKAMVKDLLDAGTNVNVKDEAGRTPLTEAAWNGHTETIKLLLERGADPNIKKNDGQTALSLALARGKKEAVEALKNAKAK